MLSPSISLKMKGLVLMDRDLFAAFNRCTGLEAISAKELAGSRTNRNYKVDTDSGSYAMRIPGRGTNSYIDRFDEMRNLSLLQALPFTPVVVYSDAESGILITRFIEGSESMTANDLDSVDGINAICHILTDLHNSSVEFGNTFDYRTEIKRYQTVLHRLNPDLPAELSSNQDALETAVECLYLEYGLDLVPCHCDTNLNNFLKACDRTYLIDWEYSGLSERLSDLANIVMTDSLTPAQENSLLEAYSFNSGVEIDKTKYLLVKVVIDYMWAFWHLIKLNQGLMVDYNSASWKKRVQRALANLEQIREL